MTKPTSYAQWDSNSTNLSAPTGGHKTDGWATNEIPTAAEMNGWQKLVADWTQYVNDTLNDGIVNFSLTAAQNNADLNGSATTTNIRVVRITDDGTHWNFNGIQGGVGGREIDIVNVGTSWFGLGSEAPGSTAANRIVWSTEKVQTNSIARVFPGGVVRLRYDGTTSRWRVLSHTGCKFLRVNTLSIADATVQTGASDAIEIAPNNRVRLAGSASVLFPVVLPYGSLWYSWTAYFNKLSDNTKTISTKRNSNVMNTTASTTTDTVTNSINAPGIVGLSSTVTGGEIRIGSGNIADGSSQPSTTHYIMVTSTATVTRDEVLGVDIFYWADF